MGITITAENLADARDKLSLRDANWPIKVRFIENIYNDEPISGCIVDAVGSPGQNVQRQFSKSSDALRYIASVLKYRDDFVKDKKKSRKESMRKAAKKSK